MSELHNLTKLLKKRKRVGRGGKLGGTAGKGHKGQKARSGGYVRIGYEGGQMPLYRRLPKRGFNNADFKQEVRIINLKDLERVFENGATVNRQTLVEKGLVKLSDCSKKSNTVLIKVLGNGQLTKKLDVSADAFSKSAEKMIQDRGGQARINKEI
jgi:large subunit ribosomal protein L15